MSEYETLEDERPRKALVLHPSLKSAQAKANLAKANLAKGGGGADQRRRPEARLAEAVGLAAAIDLQAVRADVVPVSSWRPATLIGPGKVEELAAWIAENPVDVVVVDAAVTPVQQRNLEKGLGQGDRPHRPDPGDLRRAPRTAKAAAGRARASRITSGRGWCGPGPTWNASAAASASSAARAKPSSKSIAA
jgi:hypothetical protein